MLVVDPERCTGCRLCETACAITKEKICAPEKARIHVTKWENEGIYIPIVCQQCDVPICETVCPMHAVKRDSKTNAVLVDDKLCVGCRLCMQYCPLGGMIVDDKTNRIMKCDVCNGDPVCVKFCQPEALQYLEATKMNMKKRRAAAKRFSENLRKLLANV